MWAGGGFTTLISDLVESAPGIATGGDSKPTRGELVSLEVRTFVVMSFFSGTGIGRSA